MEYKKRIKESTSGKRKDQSDTSRKSNFIKDWNNLKLRVSQAEKENAKKYFMPDFGDNMDSDQRFTTDPKADGEKVQQQFSSVKARVNQFKSKLENVIPNPAIITSLKEIIEDIENEISNIKLAQRQKYENLVKEEKLSETEVSAIERRIETWTSTSKPDQNLKECNKQSFSNWETRTDGLLPEIINYNKFIQESKGIRGGWDEYDHGLFLRFRNKHNAKISFVADLLPSIPTRTEEEIFEHEKWYKKLCILNDEKKRAIHSWKKKKEEEQNENLRKLQREREKNNEKDIDSIQKQKRESDIDKKLKINAWRMDKELQRAENEEKLLKERLYEARQEQIRLNEQRKKKNQLLEYKQQKFELEQEMKRIKDLEDSVINEEKRFEASEKIAYFQQRDMKKVKMNVDKKNQSTYEAQIAEQRKREIVRRQAGVNASRDPSRLLQPTKIWEERERQKHETKSNPTVNFSIPHRAVPSWRAGLQ
ncbi:DgyrCDS6018 [Dimorphilus gyrociliatus]|uniref:DgyrCDS6018 n=1 Tax=Dimorphilus gyrociliatus TaxID=2664684 RepID=A0A7I8VLW1_9ANNE|nr:DgyrCDS6018 [Dimorphilus gyrociliatus]